MIPASAKDSESGDLKTRGRGQVGKSIAPEHKEAKEFTNEGQDAPCLLVDSRQSG